MAEERKDNQFPVRDEPYLGLNWDNFKANPIILII